MNHLIPLFVAAPLGTAFLIPVMPKRFPWIPDLLGNLVMLFLTTMSLGMIGVTGVYHMGGWSTPVGIDLRLDALSSLMLITINLIGLVSIVFSVNYMDQFTSKASYYALFLFMVVGMNGVVLSGDVFNLYVFLEITAIASYALVAFDGRHEALEASFKYIVLGSIASTLILIGIGLLYAITGTLNMVQIGLNLRSSGASPILHFVLGLFLAGFGLKAALVPFHAWLPDAHPAAPAPVSAMLSGVVIKSIGVYAIARLFFNVFGAPPETLVVFRGLGLASMLVGGLLALGQWDMKRLFAYSTIEQVGYMVLAFGLGTPLGVVGGLYHLVNHSVFKSLLFLNAGTVEYATGTRDLRKLGGLNTMMPVTSTTTLIASMSIAGVPPFNGFWSKLIIVFACIHANHYGLAFLAVVMSIITLSFQLKVLKKAFFDRPQISSDKLRSIPILMEFPAIILAVLCLALGFLVTSGLKTPLLISPAADVLLSGKYGSLD